jgi:hypothetical protein
MASAASSSLTQISSLTFESRKVRQTQKRYTCKKLLRFAHIGLRACVESGHETV